MKKILSILASLTMTALPVTGVISCVKVDDNSFKDISSIDKWWKYNGFDTLFFSDEMFDKSKNTDIYNSLDNFIKAIISYNFSNSGVAYNKLVSGDLKDSIIEYSWESSKWLGIGQNDLINGLQNHYKNDDDPEGEEQESGENKTVFADNVNRKYFYFKISNKAKTEISTFHKINVSYSPVSTLINNESLNQIIIKNDLDLKINGSRTRPAIPTKNKDNKWDRNDIAVQGVLHEIVNQIIISGDITKYIQDGLKLESNTKKGTRVTRDKLDQVFTNRILNNNSYTQMLEDLTSNKPEIFLDLGDGEVIKIIII